MKNCENVQEYLKNWKITSKYTIDREVAHKNMFKSSLIRFYSVEITVFGI